MGSPETIRVVTWIFTMLSLACVILRFYTRIRIVRSIGADDITIVVAWIFSLGLLIIWEIQIPYGLGRHLLQIPFPNWTVNFKMLWATLFPYYVALCFVKVSVILQCLRIFKVTRFRIVCWVLLAIVVAYTIWAIISAIITCHPVAYTWDKFIPGGYCTNQVPILYTNAGISIATDWAIVFLPLPVLSKLTLNRKERWGLMGVFSLGIL
ncbi:hypothetical protein K490DRAFT_37492 [Saccharata proteae CBS 121410]|uniref:Rhodopsin domain-containing protein n=1 Tax=Saccharata proteae CBS 121410 TaxID=1314787 RepID=A0A6A5YFL3_9PEZI|nr:hypothetical protein K490DRAFT_37492 [Saccharata proteae CBS 121410]